MNNPKALSWNDLSSVKERSFSTSRLVEHLSTVLKFPLQIQLLSNFNFFSTWYLGAYSISITMWSPLKRSHRSSVHRIWCLLKQRKHVANHEKHTPSDWVRAIFRSEGLSKRPKNGIFQRMSMTQYAISEKWHHRIFFCSTTKKWLLP